jgi:hypothetical protein
MEVAREWLTRSLLLSFNFDSSSSARHTVVAMRKLVGIRQRKRSWQASVTVRGHTYAKNFPIATSIEEMRAWRAYQRGSPDARVESTVQPGQRPYGSLYIYFIQCGPFVKIGRASDPHYRLRELQAGNPEELTLLATVLDASVLEGAVHDRFKHLRIRGEWFRLEPDLREFIDAVKEGVSLVALVCSWHTRPHSETR